MTQPICDVIAALCTAMSDETTALANGSVTDAATLKQELIDRLCLLWPQMIAAEADPLAALLTALENLAEAAQANARRLERSIALSAELLDVVRDELSRQTGAAAMTYGAGGSLAPASLAAASPATRLACNRMM